MGSYYATGVMNFLFSFIDALQSDFSRFPCWKHTIHVNSRNGFSFVIFYNHIINETPYNPHHVFNNTNRQSVRSQTATQLWLVIIWFISLKKITEHCIATILGYIVV